MHQKRFPASTFDSKIKATPEFRAHVAGKLSEIIDKSLLIEKPIENSNLTNVEEVPKSSDPGVKLFSASKDFFIPKDNSEDKMEIKNKSRPDLLAHRKQFKNESEENEAFKCVAVSPEWVLEQQGVYYKGPDESRSKLITEL